MVGQTFGQGCVWFEILVIGEEIQGRLYSERQNISRVTGILRGKKAFQLQI